uniref:Ubiquitin-like protease family profile domain-containing protein n=1 Tax=Opuntia streptacantha TaxID=393608 RepID=A0A7C8ZNM0_OPUST
MDGQPAEISVEHKSGSVHLFSEKAVTAYLTAAFSTDEVKLLSDVRSECKGLTGTQWNFDLSHAPQKHVNAEYLKGLINVVLARGAGDRAGRFCVGRFAIQMYCELLHERQQLYPTYCRKSVFIPPHDKARLNRVDTVVTTLAETFGKVEMGHVTNVFMPLFECVDEHWLLLVGDLEVRKFLVYDSLQKKRPGVRGDLIECARDVIGAALTMLPNYSDARQWVIDYPSCPQQGNGYDCGVYVMVLLDLISMRAEKVEFDPQHVRQVRDKLLLSLLQGKIAHFPGALLPYTVPHARSAE